MHTHTYAHTHTHMHALQYLPYSIYTLKYFGKKNLFYFIEFNVNIKLRSRFTRLVHCKEIHQKWSCKI